MSYINFGNNMAQTGFQNALSMGLQMGAQAAESANRRGFNNALANFDPSNAESWKEVAKYDARTGFALRQQGEAQQRQARVGQVAQAALAGDNQALAELFTLEPDMWSKLDTRQREGMKQATSYMGQAAFQIGRLPEQQRPQAWAAAVAEAERSGMDIPAYMESYTPDVLNSVIGRAELMEKYIKQFEPDWRAVPQGGYLEDVNPLTNPSVGGNPAPQQPAQQPANTLTFEQYRGALNGLGAERTAAWLDRHGFVVTIANDNEFNALPSGATFRAPDGTIRRKP